MFVWVSVAAAADLTLAQARELGAPDAHNALASCDCIELVWHRDPEDLRFVVQRASLHGVRRDLTSDGRHDLALLLADDVVLPLELAPCPIVASMASQYSGTFAVPVSGSGKDAACVDAIEPIRQLLMGPKLVPLTSPSYGKLANVAVTTNGEIQQDLQDRWAGERPWIGRCYPSGMAGRTVLSGRVERDGGLSHVRVEVPGPGGQAADTCVADRVGVWTGEAGHKRRILVDVSVAGPVSP